MTAANTDAYTTAAYIAAGAADAATWATRFTPAEATQWINSGYGPDGANHHASYGRTPTEAVRYDYHNPAGTAEYVNAGITNPTAWIRSGFVPADAAAWAAYGFSPVKATQWISYGYGPELAYYHACRDLTPAEATVHDLASI